METIVEPSVRVKHDTKIRYSGSRSSSEELHGIDHINVSFFIQNITRDWLVLEDFTGFIREERLPMIVRTCYLSRQQLFNSSSAQETIKNNLMNWPVPADILNEIVEKVVWGATLKVGQSFAQKYDTLDMLVACIVECDRTFVSGDEIAISMEESEYRMVPATDSSIESLKRKIIECETNESCSICLEELSSGCEAFCMPCSHMFHGDCIRGWLRTSHYCPNCRYEMPKK